MIKKNFTEKNILFFIITVLCLIFITRIKDIAILFFASYVISCSLNPFVDKLSAKMNRAFASAILLVLTLILFLIFFVPIVATGGYQIKSFVAQLPVHFEYIKSFLLNLPYVSASSLKHISWSDVATAASGFTGNFLSKSIDISKHMATAVIYFLAACLIIYYFLTDKKQIRNTYISLFPSNLKDKANEIITSISQKIGGYVIAQIATMASVGIIIFIGLLLIKVDYSIVLALITAILDIVPVVGPAIALVIILISVYKLGAVKIGLTILIFAFAQWAENNIVRPYIFSKLLNIHPLIIYFFLFLTAQYLGILGVIFAPAIAATVCVLIEELYIKNIND